MSSLGTIMTALADSVQAAMDDDYTIQVYARMVASPTPPTIDVFPAPIARDPTTASYGDVDGAYVFSVRAVVGTIDHEAGQDVLIDFLDDEHAHCITAAIYDDPTLGGHAEDVDVIAVTGFTPIAYPDGTYLGCIWTVRVLKADS